jgi:S1-C subfamily serine protease
MVAYVDPRSQAAMNGVLKTDVITSVSLAPVASIVDIKAEVEAAHSQGREHVLLGVFKLATGRNRNIAIQLK